MKSLLQFSSFKMVCSYTLLISCILNSFTAFSIPSLIRGPYLQSATSVSIVIRWRTDEASNSQVKFGSSAANLNKVVDDVTPVTEHEVKLTGLNPKTRYYYSIGSSSTVLQGNSENYFETPPLPGAIGKYRIGVIGDCGNNSVNQLNVRDQVGNYLGANYMNAWILLGDNAYSFGTDPEYQSNFFNVYKDGFLKKSPLYPAPGNHDYADNSDHQNDHNIPYYDVFTIPKQGEAGGVASGTEAYYSFDYGNIHFLSLDSYGKEDNATRLYDTLGKQVTWIKQDLAANANKDWIVAYWHHPPYSKGSHDSDTESSMLKIRTDFIRILERNGVDLILCGHSHDYERSKLMQGHYGLENSLDPSVHNLSSSSGMYDGSLNSCPYEKKSAKNRGTVYVVSGSAGQLGGMKANYPHDALPFSNATHGGGMVLEVEGNRLDAKWIGADGVIRDKFTLEKDVSRKTNIDLTSGNSVTLNSSFIGTYKWNMGATSRSIVVSPTVDTDYIVKDNFECLSDTFHVKVSPVLPVKLISFDGVADDANQVTLKWVTSFEQNASQFVIERSTDSITFVEISKIPAQGNSQGTSSYAAIDSTAGNQHSEKYYYRLKQIDQDGTYIYSKMIVVKLHSLSANFDLSLVPNPSGGSEVTLKLTRGSMFDGKVTVYNLTGNQVFEKELTFSNTRKITFPRRLQAGIYLFRFTSGGNVLTKKVVVQ
ncbi:metallophosphoesterase [Dyadobacter sp. CY323]|uniref:metallophosphoesterase n=1 Tax=Dyadobacter sp. CY323 TaxID=2907302 RepID=UPI001F282A70|nr:metallophosphoesterase [Dyadobacter sp. CY323]MCE6990019.1 metallophosphoesterase [Dyadobacter sp. CY323]